MSPADDLHALFRAMQEQRLDPGQLARLALDWDCESKPSFLEFLHEQGALKAAESQTATFINMPNRSPADGSLSETPTLNGSNIHSYGTPDLGEYHAQHPDPAQNLPRYERRHLHRTGGLGEIWVADDRVLGRTVALKAIRPARAANPALQRRFLREAKLTSQLEHPGIVPLYDLVNPDDGPPQYVMRFLEGNTLSDLISVYHQERVAGTATAMSLRNLLEAFVAVCRAVAFAHSRGILHRDLKGPNIILGEYGQVFLVDWGLARRIADAPDPDSNEFPAELDDNDTAFTRTRTGVIVGTPAYMSPEVADGKLATTASDVYGLGAVLYQILSGHPPVDGPTPEIIIARVASGERPPPIRESNPEAPPALEAICLKAMAVDPAVRYGTAEDLAQDVRHWLADEPVAVFPDPWPVRLGRWARRRRTAVISTFAVLLVSALGSALAGWLIWQEKERVDLARRDAVEARDLADEARRKEEKERQHAEATLAVALNMTNNFAGMIGQTETGQSITRPGTIEQRKAAIQEAIQAMETFLAFQPDDADHKHKIARLLRYAANLSRLTGDVPLAERTYERAVELYQDLVKKYPDQLVYTRELALSWENLATTHGMQGQLTQSLRDLENATKLVEPILKDNPEDATARRALGIALNERSDAEYQLGRFTESEQSARESTNHFGGLLQAPKTSHFVDSVYCGMAYSNAARAKRAQILAAGGTNFTPVHELHRAAIDTFEKALLTSEHIDVRHNYYRALLEKARTSLLVPGGLNDRAGARDLERAIAGWRQLIRENSDFTIYEHSLAQGLITRGELLATQIHEGKALTLAELNFTEAIQIMGKLATTVTLHAEYYFDHGRALQGLARLLFNKHGKGVATTPYQSAASRFRGAANRLSPENVHYKKQVEQIHREAASRGIDATKLPAKTK